MNTISFYKRFVQDIIAGTKIITIRDDKAKGFIVGQIVKAVTDPDHKIFAELQIRSVEPILFNEINNKYAEQENMSLLELRKTIQEIYPDVDELYVIGFRLIE